MQLEVGAVFEGKVTGITGFGAFVELPEGKSGMVHISEVADVYVSDIHDFIKDGQVVKVKIISIGDNGKISLSMKKAEPQQQRPHNDRGFQRRDGGRAPQNGQGGRPAPQAGAQGGGRPAPRVQTHRPPKQPQKPVFTGDPNVDWTPTKSGNAAFEDMMQKFKQSSEESISAIKKAGGVARRGSSRRGK